MSKSFNLFLQGQSSFSSAQLSRLKVKLKKKYGILADIAPTILDLMKLEKPDNMNGCSLIK